MFMKYSSALLAVAISTMMNSTEAVKIQEETGLVDFHEVASSVFEVADQNEDEVVTEPELGNALEKLLQSFDNAFENLKKDDPVDLPRCFIDPSYTEDQIMLWPDLKYGRAWNGKTNSWQDLKMDAYAPKPDLDKRTRKPVIVFLQAWDNFASGDKRE